MGRWTQYDEDSYRLPAGMVRIGYDADTGQYRFRDRDGSVWDGPSGSEYGPMRQVGYSAHPVPTDGLAKDQDDSNVLKEEDSASDSEDGTTRSKRRSSFRQYVRQVQRLLRAPIGTASPSDTAQVASSPTSASSSVKAFSTTGQAQSVTSTDSADPPPGLVRIGDTWYRTSLKPTETPTSSVKTSTPRREPSSCTGPDGTSAVCDKALPQLPV
ncbi:hypothetical protein OH77DRAFT_1429843 [Trametes cingulata]|nr:hypothetical protein OH77DRAFT_1429843 [Trametes cingulata]